MGGAINIGISGWRDAPWPIPRDRPGTTRRPARAVTRRARRDLFCYFDNDIKVRAPFDARRLLDLLGLTPPPADTTAFFTPRRP